MSKIRLKIDSLSSLLNNAALTVDEKAAIHFEMAKNLKMTDLDSAVTTLNASIKMLRDADNKDRLYYHLFEKISCLNLNHKHNEIVKIFNEVIQEVELNTPEILQLYYSTAGSSYKVAGIYDTAFLYTQTARESCLEFKSGRCSDYLSSIAQIFAAKGDFEKAKEVCMKAIEEDNFGNKILKYVNLGILSNILVQTKDAALWTEINNKKMAFGFEPKSTFHLVGTELNDLTYDEKVKFLKDAIEASKNANTNYSRIIGILSTVHLERKNLDGMRDIVENFIESKDSVITVYTRRYIVENYVKMLKEREDYKSAYLWNQRNKVFKDSLDKLSNDKLIIELEEKYKSAEKDKELIENKMTIQARTNQRNIFLSLGLVLTLLSFLAFNRFRSKQKLDASRILHLEKEKKILSMNAMLEGQEAERLRIAKDLHDGLGGLLSSVKARLSKIMTEVSKIESFSLYEKTTEMVDDACDEVRRISHNLLPGSLRLAGLKTAVEQLGEELNESHSFEVKTEVLGYEDDLDQTTEVFIFRIIQEAINNIIKHAKAKIVLVQLSETDDEYHITIEDDGQGFDTQSDSEGLGLKSIRSRVEFLKGELDLVSNLGIGSTLTVHVPKTLE